MVKSEIIEKEEDNSYPYLGELNSGGMIILFIGPNEGVVVHANKNYINHEIGEYGDQWYEENFTPCEKGVFLTNV